jgi:hypothetical protein
MIGREEEAGRDARIAECGFGRSSLPTFLCSPSILCVLASLREMIGFQL